jgi:DHA2 family multidrug resistance protein
VGLGLVAVGLGALQIMLDKGEREDWFASPLIKVTAALAAVGLVSTIVWELRHPHPVIELRLLGERNFGASNLLMLLLGFVLLASTVLIPQLAQSLLGYTALRAGLVISPGAFGLMALMPVVGFLVSRVDVRGLIIFGLVITSLALLHMSHWSLAVDFRTLALGRAFQAAGLAFIFVPINTASYAFVPREKTNAASGLINLSRNVGGSIGIAFMQSFLARQTQEHQTYISAHLTPYDPTFTRALAATTRALTRAGLGPIRAARASLGLIYAEVGRQSAMLAFADCFRLMAVCFASAILLVFIIKKPKPGTQAPVH